MAGSSEIFPPATEAEWKRLVERALEGRPFEGLASTTFEGLRIEPLYERPLIEAAHALRQKPGSWKISQRIDHPDPETANQMARVDLEGGADALALTIASVPAARGFGVRIEDERDLDRVLADIDLDLVPLRLDAGARAFDLASSFTSFAQHRRLTSAALDVDFAYDPVGLSARSGIERPELSQDLAKTHGMLRDAGFAGHLLLADGRPYHEAGAGGAQELACVIATGVEYLRLLEAQGLSLEDARDEIAFLLTADADEFLSLAKFRALRRLWARVESACDLVSQPLRLHAETSFRMMTRQDPFVNILRATMGVFAAGVGGADAITALPFTLTLGLPDDFARRIARNTQLVLIHEASLAKVADPAAGAGSFEALTAKLCEQAWSLFQSFEAMGGISKSLQAGEPQKEIAATAAARYDAIAHRKLAITGTSEFPAFGETTIRVLGTSSAIDDRVPAVTNFTPLPSHRDAEPFEMIRAVSDEEFSRTGTRPKIFLANLGVASDFTPASTFATNFFAVAGLEAQPQGGFETAQHAGDAFRESGCKIACICTQAMTNVALTNFAQALHTAGAMRIYLAGPKTADAALLEAWAVKLICADSNALAILSDAVSIAVHDR